MRKINKQIVKRTILLVLGFVVIGVIIWVDVKTSFWQEVVILGGVAAGLVTFILTVLVLDRVLARSRAKRWEPITHLALTEVLHKLANESTSEISRGIVNPKTLTYTPLDSAEIIDGKLNAEHLEDLHLLRTRVVAEHIQLQKTLATWANFLAGSDATEDIIFLTADLALQLDELRDATLALEEEPNLNNSADVASKVALCNSTFKTLVEELENQIQKSRVSHKHRKKTS